MKGAAPGCLWGWVRMSGNVGSVTRDRYDELVKLGRDWVPTMSSAQWGLGDAAVEVEPMRSYGGANPSGKGDLFTVSEAIRMIAEDVGLAYTTVRGYRWVSSRWPKERRQPDVSLTIHKVLASIPDEQERFEAVSNPPPNPRGGTPRWTHDSAKRVVGWKVDSPESVQEKVEAIHDLAADDAVTQANLASTICRKGGYTSGVRPSTSVTGREKKLNAASYGYTGAMGEAEYDHLISLQLGGDPNDPRNLWIEPADPGHKTSQGVNNLKDPVETKLHTAVCAGKVTLAQAMQAIATYWTTALTTLGLS